MLKSGYDLENRTPFLSSQSWDLFLVRRESEKHFYQQQVPKVKFLANAAKISGSYFIHPAHTYMRWSTVTGQAKLVPSSALPHTLTV